jgi:hypothetical protein
MFYASLFLVNIGLGWNELAVPGDLKYHSELQCDCELHKSPKTISIEIVQKPTWQVDQQSNR